MPASSRVDVDAPGIVVAKRIPAIGGDREVTVTVTVDISQTRHARPELDVDLTLIPNRIGKASIAPPEDVGRIAVGSHEKIREPVPVDVAQTVDVVAELFVIRR